ncbi:Hypothetical protein D9617_69g077980 [Elsinoe fawcettii]|nr:Hypothetical protein D9617_69g077980 [Elsinoe fawcettii]
MTEPDQRPSSNRKVRLREAAAVAELVTRDMQERFAAEVPQYGLYTYHLDKALPGRHTRTLYNDLTRQDAGILAQARTNHCHPNSYRARIGIQEHQGCQCGEAAKTVKHVMLTCPQWITRRQTLREEAGSRWGDVSFLLGGWSDRCVTGTNRTIDGPKDKWKPPMSTVRASIQFLKSTGRMQARVEGQLLDGEALVVESSLLTQSPAEQSS